MVRKRRIPKHQRKAVEKQGLQETTTSGDWHEVFAVALAGGAILGFLALISFVPDDFPPWARQSGGGIENYVGPVGAAAAGAAFHLFGVAAYLLPLLAFAWAVGLLWGRAKLNWGLGSAAVVWVLSACCILEFQSFCCQGCVERYALPGSTGGLVGAVFGRQWLAGTLGSPGASVLVCLSYVLSLMAGTGYRPFAQLTKKTQEPASEGKAPVAPPGESVLERAGPARPRIARAPESPQKAAELPAEALVREELPPPEIAHFQEEPAKKKMALPAPERERPAVRRPVVVDAACVATEPMAVRSWAAPVELPSPANGRGGNYQLPSLGLLALPEPAVRGKADLDELRLRQSIIVETLRNFRVRVEPGDITRGPSVTRYEFYPERGLSVRRIAALEADIALATRAKRITILAPIPGKDTVGIELANEERVAVGLRELLQAGAFADAKAQIPLALGKDVYGKVLVADLAAMPHLLIAGATGSGKSVCLNAVIASLLYRFRPEELRLIMVDPKVVEMQAYARLPHLAVPVVTETKKVLLALRWCLQEMERRYRLFAETGVRRLDEYNAKASATEAVAVPADSAQGELFKEEDYFLPGNRAPEPAARPGDSGAGSARERLPRIVVIIDELADLMQVAPADVETSICRLCQKARAAGIHVIVATQSPRAEVITGLIKANIPARIAFQVASGTDSRVILDKSGAERLVGKGDMLFQPPDSAIMVRAQGAYLSDEEVERLVAHCAVQGRASFDTQMRAAMEAEGTGDTQSEINEEDEDAFQKALELIREEKRASTSFLQRRLRLGYTRAARLMDLLEERGFVGPSDGAKPREILVADPASDS